jgi:hypothetical protein
MFFFLYYRVPANEQTTQQRSFWSPISTTFVGEKSSPGLTIDQIQHSDFMNVGKNAPTPNSNTMHKTTTNIEAKAVRMIHN